MHTPPFNISHDQVKMLVEWFFMAVMSSGITFASKSFQGLCQDVKELNKNMALIVDRVERHDKEIDRLDSRVDELSEQQKH